MIVAKVKLFRPFMLLHFIVGFMLNLQWCKKITLLVKLLLPIINNNVENPYTAKLTKFVNLPNLDNFFSLSSVHIVSYFNLTWQTFCVEPPTHSIWLFNTALPISQGTLPFAIVTFAVFNVSEVSDDRESSRPHPERNKKVFFVAVCHSSIFYMTKYRVL